MRCVHSSQSAVQMLRKNTTAAKTDSLTNFPVRIFYTMYKHSGSRYKLYTVLYFIFLFHSTLYVDNMYRVRLRPGPLPGSDYINASFVNVRTPTFT